MLSIFIVLLSLFCGLLLFGLFVNFHKLVRIVYLMGSLISLKLVLVLTFFIQGFDYLTGIWGLGLNFKLQLLRVSLEYNFNGLSVLLVLLTVFLWFVCVLVSWSVKYYFNYLQVILILINFLLVQVFLVSDFLFFYIFFEALLLPMVVLIGVWGSRERKISAAYQLFLFTFFGSVFILLALLVLYSHFGLVHDFNWYGLSLSNSRQLVFWFAFFLGIMVKVPMYPLHTWLPEAHVEAPTIGSIILAGVLLKLGPYAIVRFLLNSFDWGFYVYSDKVQAFAAIAIFLASLATCMQVDMKKVVAYSSIAHMNYSIIGLFTFHYESYIGAIVLMIAHGIVSPALFLSVGFIYERYKTRILVEYGGLIRRMPVLGFMQFVFILSNMGFPGTFGFWGEFFVLIGSFLRNTFVCFIAATGIILSAAYSLMLYTSVFFNQFVTMFSNRSYYWYFNSKNMDGRDLLTLDFFYDNLNFWYSRGVFFNATMDYREGAFRVYGDLTHREFFLAGLLVFLTIVPGFLPSWLLIFIDNFSIK